MEGSRVRTGDVEYNDSHLADLAGVHLEMMQ